MLLSLQRIVARALMQLPTRLQRRIGSRVPASVDGFLLDPQIQLAIAVERLTKRPPLSSQSPESARALLRRVRRILEDTSPHVARMFDRDARGVPVRIYEPATTGGDRPALVYFHGGGGVVGDLDTHNLTCRFLAHHVGCVVVSVDYRLAPEYPFPAAPDDALIAYNWVHDHAGSLDVDSSRIAVAGDSFGGTLAAVLCLDARSGRVPMPALQLLVYPWVDMTMSQPSMTTMAEGYLLTREDIGWFRDHYLTSVDQRTDPRASPIHARELSNLCPAVIITAGFDPLRDEGKAYAEALERVGVDVDYTCHGGLIHGFAGMVALVDQANAAMAAAAEAVQRRLS